MKKAAKHRGLFDRIRGEAEHIEDVVKRLVKQAPGFLASAHEQIRKLGNDHIRPELAKGIRVIAKALDDVSGSLSPDPKGRGRKKKGTGRKQAAASRRRAAKVGAGGASRRKTARRRKKVAR